VSWLYEPFDNVPDEKRLREGSRPQFGQQREAGVNDERLLLPEYN
jgi:hypothetical protein